MLPTLAVAVLFYAIAFLTLLVSAIRKAIRSRGIAIPVLIISKVIKLEGGSDRSKFAYEMLF